MLGISKLRTALRQISTNPSLIFKKVSASSVGEPLDDPESLLLITIIRQGSCEDSCVLPATSYWDISEMIR